MTLAIIKEVPIPLRQIATEAKLAVVMRRLEVLETKDPVSINQVGPTPSVGCTYCQAMNHVFEECPVFLAHQMLPKIWMQPSQGPPTIPTLQLTILVRGITRISHGAKINNSHLPTFNPIFPIINKYFPTKFPKVTL